MSRMFLTAPSIIPTGKRNMARAGQTWELTDGGFSQEYHVFSLVWSPETISFLLDGVESQQIPIMSDMKEFLRSFYLILNLAVGGNWPGDPDQTTTFPQSMMIDYIRVFSKDGMEIPEAPPLDIEEETIGQVIEPNIGDNAIRSDFTYLGNLTVIAYGGGGEPLVATSDTPSTEKKAWFLTFPEVTGEEPILNSRIPAISAVSHLLNSP